MKLHVSVIEKLINAFETYGGHRNQTRLKGILAELDFSEYARLGPDGPGSGEKVLVLTEELEKEQATQQRR